MAYGEIKVDSITFTANGSDATVSVSGLVQNPTFSGDITVTGTISGNIVQGGTLVSGATVSGTAGEFGTITGNTAGFTTVTGTTVTGTTVNAVSGVFTTQISGATVTGDTGQFTNITGGAAGFTSVTGTTITGTTANFTSGVFTTQISGTTITGNAGQFSTLTGGTAGFTTITGTTVTGTTANFVTVSGTTVTGGNGNFTAVTTTTANVTSGVFASGTEGAPSVSVGTTDNGLYSPGADQVAISTNGSQRLLITANGAVVHNYAVVTGGLVAFSSASGGLYSYFNSGAGIIRAVTDNSGTAGTLIFATGNERMRIDNVGRVGIGTTSPSEKLDVANGSIAVGSLTNTTTTNTLISGYGYNLSGTKYGNVSIRSSYDGGSNLASLEFYTSLGGTTSTERMRIDTSGRLLVGTSTARNNFYPSGSEAPQFQLETTSINTRYISVVSSAADIPGGSLLLGKQRSGSIGGNTIVNTNDELGQIGFMGCDGNRLIAGARIQSFVDGAPGSNDMPGRLVFSTTADGAASPTERLRINNSGAFGVAGANFGTAGQVLVSNGSSAAPSWEQITPSAVFGWDHDDDTYGLYLPGTSIRTSALTGTVDIDVQSRIRRCVINDSGVVQYYLDADDSDLKSGDWLRIVETEALDTAYTGTISESTNSLLRVGVPAWAAGTFTLGQRVTHSGSLWECIAATTTATPAAGTVSSVLDGTDGQVVVEVPAFSVRYGFLNGVHTREVRLGCSDSLIAQGFQPHPAFIKTDGSYKDAFYIGAYHTYDDAGTGSSVSGQTNTRSQTRATFRTEAEARGTGWHVLSYLELAAIQTLLVCEFQDYNSQKVIGNGSDAGTTYGVTTGQSDGDGNHSVNSTDNVSDADDYMAYRGIENLYGRAWQFVDGINVYERVVYLSNDQTAFADDTADGYEFYAQVPTGSSSYQKELHPLADVFLPSVVTGSSATTYLGDAFWSSTGWRVACVGGASAYGARVGAFCLILYFDSGYSYPGLGSRLAYAAN